MREAIALVVTALAAYRLQRVVTADSWPPSRALRDRLRKRAIAFDFLTCPWCFGFWIGLVTVIVTHLCVMDLVTGHVRSRPLFVLLTILAVNAVVGKLGSRDEAD